MIAISVRCPNSILVVVGTISLGIGDLLSFFCLHIVDPSLRRERESGQFRQTVGPTSSRSFAVAGRSSHRGERLLTSRERLLPATEQTGLAYLLCTYLLVRGKGICVTIEALAFSLFIILQIQEGLHLFNRCIHCRKGRQDFL